LVAKVPRGSRAVGIEAGRYITFPEFHKLMEECLQDDIKASARDRARIALAEGAAPTYFIHIIGKGNMQRPVMPRLVGNAARYIKDWLAVRGEGPEALFCFITY
jgi:hypothetical protein